MGTVELKLNRLLGSPTHEAMSLALAEDVERRLRANEKTVPAKRLILVLPPGNEWEDDPARLGCCTREADCKR